MVKTLWYPLDILMRAKDVIEDDGTGEQLLSGVKGKETDGITVEIPTKLKKGRERGAVP